MSLRVEEYLWERDTVSAMALLAEYKARKKARATQAGREQCKR